MAHSLKSALFALAILAQPACVRAETPTPEDILAGVVVSAVGLYGAYKMYDYVTTESDEQLIERANNIVETKRSELTSWHNSRFSDRESDRSRFADYQLSSSVSKDKKGLQENIKYLRELQDALDSRKLTAPADKLDLIIAMYDEKLSYIKRHEDWLTMYKLVNTLEDDLRRGCNQFYGSSYPTFHCVEHFKKLIQELNQEEYRRSISGPELQAKRAAVDDKARRFVRDTIMGAPYKNDLVRQEEDRRKMQNNVLDRAASLTQHHEDIKRQQKEQQARLNAENAERQRRMDAAARAQKEEAARLAKEAQDRINNNQASQSELTKRINELNVFKQYGPTMDALYQPFLGINTQYNGLSPEQKEKIRKDRIYASQIEKDIEHFIAVTNAVSSNAEFSKKIITDACRNSGGTNCKQLVDEFERQCNGAAAKVAKMQKLLDAVQLQENQDYAELKTVIASVKKIYQPIMQERSLSQQLALIRKQGEHDKYPIALYLNNIETSMEKTKPMADYLCNNPRFKDSFIRAEILALVKDLNDHVAKIKASAAYQEETRRFEKQMDHDRTL